MIVKQINRYSKDGNKYYEKSIFIFRLCVYRYIDILEDTEDDINNKNRI